MLLLGDKQALRREQMSRLTTRESKARKKREPVVREVMPKDGDKAGVPDGAQ